MTSQTSVEASSFADHPAGSRRPSGSCLVWLAAGVDVGTGAAALSGPRNELRLTAGDVVGLLGGAAAAGALLAVLGLAVGTLTRSQVPTLVGLFA